MLLFFLYYIVGLHVPEAIIRVKKKSFVFLTKMFKLLVNLFVIKLYARVNPLSANPTK